MTSETLSVLKEMLPPDLNEEGEEPQEPQEHPQSLLEIVPKNWITVTHEAIQWLEGKVRFDLPMDVKLDYWLLRGDNRWLDNGDVLFQFVEWLRTKQHKVKTGFNRSGESGCLTQEILFSEVIIDGHSFALLKFTRSNDRLRMFRLTGLGDLSNYEYATIRCHSHPSHFWGNEPGSNSWFPEGNSGEPITPDNIQVDDRGRGICSVCGGKLFGAY